MRLRQLVETVGTRQCADYDSLRKPQPSTRHASACGRRPVPRHVGYRTNVLFFDGHVQGMSPMDLQDMRYWANNATTEDYDFVP